MENQVLKRGTLLPSQVYKATLRSNGKPVAVKVQRPGVLETVSLDLHLARELGYQMKKVRLLNNYYGGI